MTLLVITAVVGIPTRLYLLAAVAFNAPGLREKFLRLFPLMLHWMSYGRWRHSCWFTR